MWQSTSSSYLNIVECKAIYIIFCYYKVCCSYLNIVECKVLISILIIAYNFGSYLNIVECKDSSNTSNF